ncbi:choline-phosphate cytidylyltransferase [Arcanobacterium wilhelmae]|uniref:Choline-phosphate cytidylyltransferase n=1 Tax=Arcanobacterium wilhelmae TaxID=1803177 RepID=A0ABT9NCX7_9ACTO|nr:Gfo/Idh/MocA family oxidoreductase [Arcanobacterium wilhelmae]MDP9801226.1 choline-phosphate cytidylyltransferase [Arcanobacterium wilhelmae]
MTTVITYGTYDLLHEGHRRLLERAKALGDKLIVGVTSDSYDRQRGKLNVHDKLLQRVANVRATGLADEIVVEEYEGQKIHDIEKYDVDIFAIGSDWRGKFDYLGDYCEVVYLERTKGISSTQLRSVEDGMLALGIIGAGRSARRMVKESWRVSGVQILGLYSRDIEQALELSQEMELAQPASSAQQIIEESDAVYIASPHGTHYEYAKEAIEAGKDVLVENPITLHGDEAVELYNLAKDRGVVLLEAAKTAYFTGFRRMVEMARSGGIGKIKAVDATFTKLIHDGREVEAPDGGALSEMGTYPLMAIFKLLGLEYESASWDVFRESESGVDTFARISLKYPHAIATATVGIGVKSEGDLVVSGTQGYLYVPAPWWLTDNFELRYEDTRRNRHFFYPFEDSGYRYELAEFVKAIRAGKLTSFKWKPEESIATVKLLEQARKSDLL